MVAGGKATAHSAKPVPSARVKSPDGVGQGAIGQISGPSERDFVIPIRIGAYRHEREKTQNVRFNVDVGIVRSPHVAQDMRDVFSYDVILDGIRMLVAQEHIALIETLAERVATLILAQPRVVNVTVRIEKLDIGPGAVGVEIVRKRPAESAQVRPLQPTAGEGDPKVAT